MSNQDKLLTSNTNENNLTEVVQSWWFILAKEPPC